MKAFNKERLRAFIQRRKINALALLVLTFLFAIVTVICAVNNFPRADILAVITILMVVLCMVQEVKLRRSYRTIRSFKGSRKKIGKKQA